MPTTVEHLSRDAADSATRIDDLAYTPFGVVDIGSNSVRLVVFDGLRRSPLPLFNETVMCGLGLGLGESGRLHPDGVDRALESLERFVALLAAMGVDSVEAVATAAVRDAEDRDAFLKAVRRKCGLEVRVLSGAEEAEHAALGVLSGMPSANGLMGDLGGGSLELVRLVDGAIGEQVTLPLGPLNLMAAAGGSRDLARGMVEEALASIPWLAEVSGASLYAVGGSWRALARAHMAYNDYPLSVIDHYRVPRMTLSNVVGLLAAQSTEALSRLEHVPQRRIDLLPLSAVVMGVLLEAAQPRDVVFSASGLREGLAHARLPSGRRARDPLVSACEDIARRAARFPAHPRELTSWTRHLFPGEEVGERRLRHAACLLSDIGWRVHPDYRAEHARAEVLRAPGLHATHEERAFLAAAVCARYTSGTGAFADLQRLLSADQIRRARIIGAAVRLGGTLSGGVPGIIDRFSLRARKRKPGLRLRYGSADRAMVGEVVMRRFEVLAKLMGREPELLCVDS